MFKIGLVDSAFNDSDISESRSMTASAAEPAPNLVRPAADKPSVPLPAPGTKRWVIRRKAAVVQAVRKGAITLDDACRTYNLSPEEFNSWQRLIDRHGPRGLRATRLKDYR
jgi:hypothetical protein